MSDVVKPSRKTPPPEIAALSPPLSPKSEKAQLDTKKEEEPADLNIPDNYVAYTLRTTKPKPPVTWDNWYKELNYLSLAILTLTPTIAIVGAFYVKLRWQTLLFSVFYYFVTGLGITAGQSSIICLPRLSFFDFFRLDQATIASGLTARTTPQSHFSTSLP